MINLSGNTLNQPAKFRSNNWVKIIDDAHGTWYTNSQINFKTSLSKSRLCDYSDAYILVKATILIAAQAVSSCI